MEITRHFKVGHIWITIFALTVMLALTSCSESMAQSEKQSLATAELVDPASIYCEFRDHVWDYNWGCIPRA